MFIALVVLHILIAIVLVLVVLVQSGRGAELGAAFGGIGQAQFGRGQSTFISKLTAVLAVIFMATSLGLSLIAGERQSQSVVQPSAQAPAPAAPAAAPPASAPAPAASLPQAPAPKLPQVPAPPAR